MYPTGWDINNLIVNGNGETIADQPEDLLLNVAGVLVEFIYDGTTWLVTANLGPSGIQGTQGLQGLSGSYAGQGVQGPQGTTGIQGIQGLQGRQGVQGTQGIQGTQGVQGVQGSFGIQGIQGSQGTTGSQGVQGLQGLQGDLGLQGIQGVQSLQGLQGVNGIQGLQGINGAIGPYPTLLITAATYTALDTDYYIGVNRAGTVTITLPTPSNGNMKIIKDESGNASTYPITVAGTIDNDAGGATIQLNNGSITLIYRNGWRIV